MKNEIYFIVEIRPDVYLGKYSHETPYAEADFENATRFWGQNGWEYAYATAYRHDAPAGCRVRQVLNGALVE